MEERQTLSQMSMADLIEFVLELKARVDFLEKENTQLKEENKLLKKELGASKKIPSKPNIEPSRLETKKKIGSEKKKRNNGKKAKKLTITRTIVLKVPKENIPPGYKYKGTRSVVFQKIVSKVEVIELKYEIFEGPHGERITAMPTNETKRSHFDRSVDLHVVYQMAKNSVPQNKVWQELNERGLQISTGKINQIYVAVAALLKAEKEDILHIGLRYFLDAYTDDTGARHRGVNWYCTVIQNAYFAYFKSTKSKSRINFLEMMCADRTDYIIDNNSIEYLDKHLNNKKVSEFLSGHVGTHIEDKNSLEKFFQDHQIKNKRTRKILTESMLYAVLIDSGIPKDKVILSDGARQFDVFIHAMCWVHAVRPLIKLLPKDNDEKKLIEEIKSHAWTFYSHLKEYKEHPTAHKKNLMLLEFERIFGKKTSSEQLNKALKGIHLRMNELLLVLENPSIELHNNGSERDIREMVRKRKISGGTRSDEGLEARDTYVSLVKTCMKLSIPFYAYLEDRIYGYNKIPFLPDIIKQRAAALYSGP